MFANALSRRRLLQSGAAALAASVLPARAVLAQTPVVIGAIYVGPRDDYGWNQSHAAAMDILRGVEGVTVVEEENVAETNAALVFDRQAARGFRLNIPAGTAVRFEPGQEREVELVALAGDRKVYGFTGAVMGGLDQ